MMVEKFENLNQHVNKSYKPDLLGSFPRDFIEEKSLSYDSPILRAQLPRDFDKYLSPNSTGFIKFPNPNGTAIYFYYPKELENRLLKLSENEESCKKLSFKEKEKIVTDFMYHWAQALFTESIQSEDEKKRIDDILKQVKNNVGFKTILDEKAEKILSNCRQKKLKEIFRIPDQKTDSKEISNNIFNKNMSDKVYKEIIKSVLDYYQKGVRNVMKESLNNTRDVMQLARDKEVSVRLSHLFKINNKMFKFGSSFENDKLNKGEHQVIEIDTHRFLTNENPLEYFEDIKPTQFLPQNNRYDGERKKNVMAINPFKIWTFRDEAEKELKGQREWQIKERNFRDNRYS